MGAPFGGFAESAFAAFDAAMTIAINEAVSTAHARAVRPAQDTGMENIRFPFAK